MIILNCPFCNTEIQTVQTKGTYGYDLHYYIPCPTCKVYMYGSYENGDKHLIDKWNSRKGV